MSDNTDNCLFNKIGHLLADSEIATIQENQFKVEYRAGDILIKQGAFISNVLFLTKGIVKVIMEEKNSKQTIIKLIDENNFIGLPILGNQKKYPVSVVALSPVKVCQVHIDAMREIMNNNIDICRYFIDWYSGEFVYLYSKLSTQNTRNSHGKLASALVYLSNGTFSKKDVFVFLSRKDLADLASISLESVNKILLELKNDRIIEIKNKTIKILKPELIHTLSTVG